MGMKILYWNVIIPLLIIGCQDSISVVKQDIPDNLVVLSFDDAREDNFSFVAPLLKEYGFGATFYICEFAEFEDTTRFMTWKQIKQLADMGFEIGNHTKSHRDLEDSSQKEFVEQITYIEDKCRRWRINIPITFAYPGGRVGNNMALLERLASGGYTFARTIYPDAYNPLRDNPLLLPSYCVHSNNLNRLSEFLKKACDGNIVVLTLHGVSDTEQYRVNTSKAHFLYLLKYLKENDYSVIAMRDLTKFVDVKMAMNLNYLYDQTERIAEINTAPDY
jgi:peptidoglycan/xylan/chitin deacetylase (PgdA/CDA1 family)